MAGGGRTGRGAVPRSRQPLALLLAAGAAMTATPAAAAPAGRITGIGGVFVRSPDPAALMAWYRDVLGIALEPWGGAMLRTDTPGHPPVIALNAFGAASDYMAPSKRDFMIDFAVDDLPALLARLEAKGVAILARDDRDPTGRFAWILDLDGTKIELWQPKAPAATRP